jgi:hypothetical protein
MAFIHRTVRSVPYFPAEGDLPDARLFFEIRAQSI